MGHIVQLHADPHRQTQELLPWYVNGTLEPAEVALVEAHLGECGECRAELESERVLAPQVAGLSAEVEQGWAALRTKMNEASRRPPPAPLLARRPIAAGWALAAQLAAAAAIVAVTLPSSEIPTGQVYHALGSAPAAATGNIMVLFRPDTSERELRTTLLQADARLVDGPTASGAYVLRVADDRRAAALKRLRASPEVVLAEPVEAGGGR